MKQSLLDRGARKRRAGQGEGVTPGRPTPMIWRVAGASETVLMLFLIVAVVGGVALRLWQINGVGFNSDEAVYAGQAAAIAGDPVLTDRVLIAEPWDVGPGGYRLGSFGERFHTSGEVRGDQGRVRGHYYSIGCACNRAVGGTVQAGARDAKQDSDDARFSGEDRGTAVSGHGSR